MQPAGNGGAAPPGPGGAEWAMILCFYGVAFTVGITIQIFFLLTLSKCLKEIAPRNRSMEPGQVWLCLIPLFGTVWALITILRIAESLEQEYRSRGLRGDGDFGKQNGIIYFVSAFICGCISIVFFIMYWMKIAGYTKELRERGGSRSRERTDDDDYDRDSRRRRKMDEEDDDRDD